MEMKKRLEYFREKKGYNKKEVAEGSGIPYTTYIKYEYGEREIGVAALQKLSDFYHVTTDYLLGRPDAKTPEDPVEMLSTRYKLGTTERTIIASYLALPQDDRTKLVDIVEQVVENAKNEKNK